MQVMLKATYKRAEKYKPGMKPELISAEYGEVPDELIMGQMALGMRDIAAHRDGLYAAEELTAAIERAKAAGVLMTL